ncbi:hypothetical protein SAMN04488563_4296 [Jiangella alkaliphila]|uniref:Uncharacterized protein n=1 Tax=Jiangella alkaliphila TaxID=419479 RepID=A0A1H2KUS8_9ACTN|nr:hypothetical protein SAMN04488563_4296 [Jiangella alkaliphila]
MAPLVRGDVAEWAVPLLPIVLAVNARLKSDAFAGCGGLWLGALDLTRASPA